MMASTTAAATSSSSDDEDNQNNNNNNNSNNKRKRLLLVGGGHAHIQVLKSLNWASRPDDLDVTVVDLTSTPSYSGMVPATVAGLYKPDECQIQLKSLTEWSKINFVQGEVIDIDFVVPITTSGTSDDDDDTTTANNNNSSSSSSDTSKKKNVATVLVKKAKEEYGAESEENGSKTIHIPFDVISLDIGSASRGIDDVKGAREYTIPTRPISNLVNIIERTTEQLKQQQQQQRQQQTERTSGSVPPSTTPIIDVVVVGSGAAGIELAMALWGRWKPIVTKKSTNTGSDNNNENENELFRITLLDAGKELFPNETEMNRQALRRVLNERSIKIRHGVKVDEVLDDKKIVLSTGETLHFTHCLWATGATSHPLASKLSQKGLPIVEDRGWIRVNQYLQSVDTTNFPHVFAAGDCCTIERRSGGEDDGSDILPPPPKAGVYAVRAGPILIENLISSLYSKRIIHDVDSGYESDDKTLTPYIPQGDFLKLIVCGDGKALGFRFGVPLYGKWVFKLKDAIDRSFMELFQEQNLPKLVKGQPYDVSQYDSTSDRPPPLDPADAATLLTRTDDDVDFRQAWDVLRDMAQDDSYKDGVLVHMTPDQDTREDTTK